MLLASWQGIAAESKKYHESNTLKRKLCKDPRWRRAFSHAIAGLSVAACFYRTQVPNRIWVAGATGFVLPDIDVVGFRLGIGYGHFWGHRGFIRSFGFCRGSVGCVQRSFSMARINRDRAPCLVGVFVSGHRESARRHDQRRTRCSVLFTF